MNKSLEELVARGRKVAMTNNDKEKQRESFAYGTTKIENDRVTKDTVREAIQLERRADGRG